MYVGEKKKCQPFSTEAKLLDAALPKLLHGAAQQQLATNPFMGLG
jgi:hypothetical protein